MKFRKGQLAEILRSVDLGNGVAEQDTLLQAARIDTSVLTDLLNDRVDLIPGAKGSGKSALYRIFVEFLPDVLLNQRRIVIAHGVQSHGEPVFQVFKDRFARLSEPDFVNFWCVYLASLAYEHFIKDSQYKPLLENCSSEIEQFRRSCRAAKIPEIPARLSLKDVLEWVLNAMPRPKKISYSTPEGKVEVDLFGEPATTQPKSSPRASDDLPRYIGPVKESLERILSKSNLHLWFMVDRLDEIFPRRSQIERRALRGILKTLQIFESPQIRLKVFLRDDILTEVTERGFTGLTHVTSRQADRLTWSEDQILTLIVKRLFASESLQYLLTVDAERLDVSRDYQRDMFYRVFPPTVHRGKRQSATLRWIYTHTMDGRNVVTPRDVIDLLTRAKQRQHDEFEADSSGTSDVIIGSPAIQYGLEELSVRKKESLLKAEFPQFWPHIARFQKGKTSYSEQALRRLFADKTATILEDLLSIGVLREKETRQGERLFEIPFVFRYGLELTQGRAG